MAAGWSVLDALNKNSKAAAEEKPKARFRTRDISIRKMYTNAQNFYSMPDIEQLAQEILAVGLMENMTVSYEPCEKGEYKIIAGERRWRALSLLLEKGYEEFEVATCRITSAAEENEEMVQLIMANAYREKTVPDLLEEERQLKKALQNMKEQGLTLQGYKLDSGRLRDVIASIMNTTATKVAQIESINKRLIPEFSEELKGGRLTFSAAYEISGMEEEKQQELLKRYQENGLSLKDVKEAKKALEEERAAREIPGRMTTEELLDAGDALKEERKRQEKENWEEPKRVPKDPGDDWEDAHPESITSICYSCLYFSDCNVKTGTCRSCDKYQSKAEAEKTPEQRYDEEQAAIDRETQRKLREQQERQEEKERDSLKSEKQKEKELYLSPSQFDNIENAQLHHLIVKIQGEPFRENEILTLKAMKDGKEIGQQMRVLITCMDDADTSSAIVQGYAVLGIMDIYDAEALGLIELEDEE